MRPSRLSSTACLLIDLYCIDIVGRMANWAACKSVGYKFKWLWGRHSWLALALVEFVRLIVRRQKSLHKRSDKIFGSLYAGLELHLDYFILMLLVAIRILGVYLLGR
jgi:hypothetical protein